MISLPPHVLASWRHFNCLIDAALAADVKPWGLAEAFAFSIWTEWMVAP